MEYDPQGSELLDVVNHYVSQQKTRIWATSVAKGLAECKSDTDLFVMLTQLNESDSLHVVKQAEELAMSIYPDNLDQ